MIDATLARQAWGGLVPPGMLFSFADPVSLFAKIILTDKYVFYVSRIGMDHIIAGQRSI